MSQKKRAVFLDRDGVLNRCVVRDGRPYPPAGMDQMEILPGVAQGLEKLKKLGLLLIVVTNQPDVAAGKQPRHVLDAFHKYLMDNLVLDEIRACIQLDSIACRCYKPKPGMLLDAAADFGIDLSTSYMVGDRWRDVGAGRNAGCYTVFVDYHYSEQRPDRPDAVFESAAAALDFIRNREEARGRT